MVLKSVIKDTSYTWSEKQHLIHCVGAEFCPQYQLFLVSFPFYWKVHGCVKYSKIRAFEIIEIQATHLLPTLESAMEIFSEIGHKDGSSMYPRQMSPSYIDSTSILKLINRIHKHALGISQKVQWCWEKKFFLIFPDRSPYILPFLEETN